MKRIFLYILSVFTLLSCRNSKDHFLLSGEFDHLQQGEFYIYSPEGAIDHLDTVKLVEGKFEYRIPLKKKTTLMLLYPNFSEHVIFAEGGQQVKLKGDARKLNETEITGSPENEDMTQFRMKNLKSSKQELVSSAEQFIRKQPESAVSIFLFKEYFLNYPKDNYKKVWDLYQVLTKAQPENIPLKALRGKILALGNNTVGKKLPSFTLSCIKGDTIHSDRLSKQLTLISFWASWRNSGYIIYQTKKLQRKYSSRLGFFSYSLDINPQILKGSMQRDTINWPVYCDFKAWDNPLLQKLNINDIPYHILIDHKQTVIARGRSLEKDIRPEIEKRLK